MDSSRAPSALPYPARLAVLFAAYVITARAGLQFAEVGDSATVVWAPTGIALVATLRWGRGMWPAILLGALVANLMTPAPLGSVLGIACGNTLEALAGAWLLGRVTGFRPALDRVEAVLALVALGAVLSTTIGATAGVASLYAGGAVASGDLVTTWHTWWIGDLGGDLIVAPLLLVCATSRPRLLRGRRALEAGVFAVLLLGAAGAVFATDEPVAYVVLPILVWIALSFGRTGAVLANFAIAVVALGFTAAGSGPFTEGPMYSDLLEAQLFACVCALCSLLVAAARSERTATQRRLIAQDVAAAERARTEERTRTIVESARDAFVAIDGAGVITDWNRQSELMFGYTRDEALGRLLVETIVPPVHRDAHERGMRRFLEHGEARVLGQRLELSALRRDGTEVPVELTINPVATDAGWGFNAFLHDLTDRTRRRRHLDTEYAVARLLSDATGGDADPRVLEALGEGLGWGAALWWVVDADHGLLRCVAGWHADPTATGEIERLSRASDLLPGGGLPGRVWVSGEQQLGQAVPATGTMPRAVAARAAGLGGVSAFPLVNAGTVLGVIEVYTDAAGDVRAEELRLLAGLRDRIGAHVARTRAQEAYVEVARHFESSQDVLCTAGFDGYYRNLNHRWEEVFGWTHEELRSRPFIEFMHPDDQHAVRDVVVALERGAATVVDFECRHHARDGSWRMIAWSATVSPEGVLYGSGRDVTDRVRAEQAQRLQAEIARNMAEGVLLVRTSDWTVVYANDKLAETFGYEPGELEGLPVELLVPERDGTDVAEPAPIQEALARDGEFSGEVENARKDGSTFWSHVNISNFQHPEHGEVSVAVHADITAEKAAREALAEAEERFRRAFEDAGAGMALLGVRGADAGRFVEVNDALCHITGYAADELLRTGLAEITHVDDLASTAEATRRLLAGEIASYQSEKRLLDARGQIVWVSLSTSLVRDRAGEPLHRIAHLQDISERKRFEGQLQHLADHDSLTGLFNRRRFEEELGRELVAARRYGTGGAVLALDIDNFKYVNDSLGHAAGDELIAKVGRLVTDRVRESDIVARLGGDEFAVILPHADEAEARGVAQDLVDVIRGQARVMTEAGARRVSASIGVALFYDDPDKLTSEDLLVEADIAMYDAKEGGRDQIAVFDAAADRQARMQAHLTWAERIREALEQDRFELHAQPIVALQPGGDAGRARYELLLRMRSPGGELVPPNTFLPVAERSNLIVEIDHWVVRSAIALLAEQQRAGIDVCFELNLSAKSITDPATPELVARELARTGVDPRGLVFEITETAAIVNVNRARDFATRLHELGCRFALDDFGAGFASFHYLKHLDFDYLKIDGEFIQDLPSSRTNQLVVKAVVQMAHGLNKATIAEYVEDEETLELLRGWGVDFAQGFHVGRPRPLETFSLRPLPRGPASRSAAAQGTRAGA